MLIEIVPSVRDGGATARDLYAWLRGEDGLRGRVRLVQGDVPPERMGAQDVVAVAVGAGGAGTVLVQALVGWPGRRSGEVALVLRRPDGARVELKARGVADPEEVVRLVGELLSERTSSGDDRETA